ncbi:MAG: SDR family oxidoreductase [Candidatus Acidiferrales bacterium]
MSLKGKTALITGSSRGIGRGIALKLAESGAKVAVHYYQKEASAKDTLAKVRQRGSDGFIVQADVSRPDDIRAMFERVKKEFGHLDIFISNARTELPTFYRKPLDIGLDQWDLAQDSQAKAFLVGVREAVPLMPKGGRIIAITYAPGGRLGSWQSWVAMGSAKAALESLCRYFAVALALRGITVNAISPGLTEDSVFNGLPPEVRDRTRAWHASGWTPMGRMGTPADIGNVVALFCSEEAAWITGQVVYADGGASLVDTLFPLEIQQA